MATGSIKIGNMILPTCRCKKTGLIMVNLTEGIDIKGFAKCHRSLRLKDESMPTVGPNSFVGSTDMSRRDVEAVVKSLRGGVCPAASNSIAGLGYGVQVLVTTRGVRFTPSPGGDHGRERLMLDCRSIHDPDASNHLRGHLGSHCDILKGVAGQRATRDLMESVRDFLNTNRDRMIWLDLFLHEWEAQIGSFKRSRRDFLDPEEDFICDGASRWLSLGNNVLWRSLYAMPNERPSSNTEFFSSSVWEFDSERTDPAGRSASGSIAITSSRNRSCSSSFVVIGSTS